MPQTPTCIALAIALLSAAPAAQIAPQQLPARTAVGAGITLQRGETQDPAGRPQSVAALVVDLATPGTRLELALADGLEPTSLLAQRGGALAAINGGFFTKARRPSGMFRIGGSTITPAATNRQSAFVLDDGGTPGITIDRTGEFAGPPNVLAAGPCLVQNGALPEERTWSDARHPRSAVGLFADDCVLLLTVDGRHARAAGMTLDELGETLIAFGCEHGINLDGGGSTTLWVSGAPRSGIVNHPSDNKAFDDGGERPVANAVLVFAEPAKAAPRASAEERRSRTARDFRLTRERLLQQLERRVSDFAPGELDGWIARGLVDRDPNGGDGFAGPTVSNLFFRDTAIRKRRKQGRTHWPMPTATRELKFDIEVELIVQADAVPAGETIRAWLPFPQEYEHQRVISAAHGGAAAAAPMRAVYLEQVAEAGKPTVFATSYRIARSGVEHGALDATNARLPHSPAFTTERQPHVVATPALRELADTIARDETNPLRIARAIYDWCGDNLTYSYAREYSTIPCIPSEVLRTRRGDCGQLTLTFMTLCRLRGIPARWQSGWVIQPGKENLHDWCEIRIAPWGWLPVDVNTAVELNHADDLTPEERAAVRDFAFGNLDGYRLVVNRDHARPLVPAKYSERSDDVDFQRGEVEWGTPARNLYYDRWSYRLQATVVE